MLLPFKFCAPRELGSCKMPSAYQLLLCTLSWRQQVISTRTFRLNNDWTKLIVFWQHLRFLVLYVALYKGNRLTSWFTITFFFSPLSFYDRTLEVIHSSLVKYFIFNIAWSSARYTKACSNNSRLNCQNKKSLMLEKKKRKKKDSWVLKNQKLSC